MPLVHGFRSTSIWRAFVLNSIATTLVIFIAVTVKGQLDTYKADQNEHDEDITCRTNFTSIVATILATFLTSMAAYTLMYFVFGFGGGMLVDE